MAKAQPGKLDYGSTGIGTSGHLAMELFRITAGIDIVHVPFRNVGQWVTDMIAGRIALGMPTVPGATSHIRAGRLRALGVTGKARSVALPAVPTVAEAGLPGYATTTWYPLLAPRGTPGPIIDRVNAAFRAAIEDPANKAKLLDLGVEAIASTPAEALSVTSLARPTVGPRSCARPVSKRSEARPDHLLQYDRDLVGQFRARRAVDLFDQVLDLLTRNRRHLHAEPFGLRKEFLVPHRVVESLAQGCDAIGRNAGRRHVRPGHHLAGEHHLEDRRCSSFLARSMTSGTPAGRDAFARRSEQDA